MRDVANARMCCYVTPASSHEWYLVADFFPRRFDCLATSVFSASAIFCRRASKSASWSLADTRRKLFAIALLVASHPRICLISASRFLGRFTNRSFFSVFYQFDPASLGADPVGSCMPMLCARSHNSIGVRPTRHSECRLSIGSGSVCHERFHSSKAHDRKPGIPLALPWRNQGGEHA